MDEVDESCGPDLLGLVSHGLHLRVVAVVSLEKVALTTTI